MWMGLLSAAIALVLLLTLAKARAAGSLLASAAGGVAGLWAVSLISVKGAALIACNAFTLAVSALLGIPGVVGLLLLRVIALA